MSGIIRRRLGGITQLFWQNLLRLKNNSSSKKFCGLNAFFPKDGTTAEHLLKSPNKNCPALAQPNKLSFHGCGAHCRCCNRFKNSGRIASFCSTVYWYKASWARISSSFFLRFFKVWCRPAETRAFTLSESKNSKGFSDFFSAIF